MTPSIFGSPNFFSGQPGEAEKIPSHLKKSCANGPAGHEGCPGSTYARGRGLDSRPCAYVLNFARARFGGPARLGGFGSGPGRVWLAVQVEQAGRVRLPLQVEQAERVGSPGPARSSGPGPAPGPVRLARLAIPLAITGATAPAAAPAAAPGSGAAPGPGPAGGGRAGPAPAPGGAGRAGPASVYAPGVGLVRRGSMFPASVRLPCRSGSWSGWWKPGGSGAAGLVRRGSLVRVRRGHFRKQPRFFRPLHRAENFQRFFRRGILCARYSFLKDYIFTPPIAPQKSSFSRQISQKQPANFVQKKFPTPPLRGAGGKVFGGLTAARPSANIRDKPRPHGPGPTNRPKRDSSGGTHSTVQSAQRKTHSTVQIAQTEKSL